MVVEIEFACPACSNYFGKLYTLNSISQSTDHFNGIKHARIMRRIGPVLTRGMLYNFFKLLGPCGSKYIDYIDAGTKPIDVFRDYAYLCVAARHDPVVLGSTSAAIGRCTGSGATQSKKLKEIHQVAMLCLACA